MEYTWSCEDMADYPALLNTDYYRLSHIHQYPEGIQQATAYLTPRTCRIKGYGMENGPVVFGMQGFVNKYLKNEMNNWFKLDKKQALANICEELEGAFEFDALEEYGKLHDLGYLPLKIRGLPEGTICPIGCPMFQIENTEPEFAWLVNSIETMMSATIWHACVGATVGAAYKRIVNKYYEQTVCDTNPRDAMSDFSMRGQESIESAVKCSAGWGLSFNKTATVGANRYLKESRYTDKNVMKGTVSTEHSTMCSNYAVQGNEETFYHKLLNEIYPHESFAVVADAYDYWGFINDILPKLKEDILNHDGKMLVRGDSGDPVEITLKTVPLLWEQFRGTINAKGYKVLCPKIGFIYGDAITLNRCESIYKGLQEMGFASDNVILAAGSFSMQAFQDESGKIYPFTRDTYGFATKVTHIWVHDVPYQVFKAPKTDPDSWKKSQKGKCRVWYEDGKLKWEDKLDIVESESAYMTYFEDWYDPKNWMVSIEDVSKVLEKELKKEGE